MCVYFQRFTEGSGTVKLSPCWRSPQLREQQRVTGAFSTFSVILSHIAARSGRKPLQVLRLIPDSFEPICSWATLQETHYFHCAPSEGNIVQRREQKIRGRDLRLGGEERRGSRVTTKTASLPRFARVAKLASSPGFHPAQADLSVGTAERGKAP